MSKAENNSMMSYDVEPILKWTAIGSISIYFWYVSIPIFLSFIVWKNKKWDIRRKIVLILGLLAIPSILFGVQAFQNRRPIITIIEPNNEASIEASEVTIVGEVNPKGSIIRIDSVDVEVHDGMFSYIASIPNELNYIKIQASHSKKDSFQYLNIISELTEKDSFLSLSVIRVFTEEEIEEVEAELAAQQKAEEDRLAAKRAELIAWDNSSAGKLCAEHPTWTNRECTNVVNKKIWIGMSYDMLIESYGSLPNSANPSNYGYGTQWQWCWTYGNPSCFYDDDNDGLIDSYN